MNEGIYENNHTNKLAILFLPAPTARMRKG